MTEINGHDVKRRQFAEKIQALMQAEQPDAFTAFSVLEVAAKLLPSSNPGGLELGMSWRLSVRIVWIAHA